MPNSAAMLRCSSLRFVLSTLSARLPSAVHSPFNNDPIRLCVFSIFALLTLLGTNQITPLAEVPIDPWPFGICVGQHPPFDAPSDDREDGIDHRPHIAFAVAPTRLGWRDPIFDQIPFSISEVCRVWLCIHPSSVPN